MCYFYFLFSSNTWESNYHYKLIKSIIARILLCEEIFSKFSLNNYSCVCARVYGNECRMCSCHYFCFPSVLFFCSLFINLSNWKSYLLSFLFIHFHFTYQHPFPLSSPPPTCHTSWPTFTAQRSKTCLGESIKSGKPSWDRTKHLCPVSSFSKVSHHGEWAYLNYPMYKN